MFLIYKDDSNIIFEQKKRVDGYVPLVELACTHDSLNITFGENTVHIRFKEIIELNSNDDYPEKSIWINIKTRKTQVYFDHFPDKTCLEIHDEVLPEGRFFLQIDKAVFIRLTNFIVNGEDFFLELFNYLQGCMYHAK